MTQIKRRLILYIWFKLALAQWTIYFIVWCAKMFVEWGYVNPFGWMAAIPYEDDEYRVGVLAALAITTIIKIIITSVVVEHSNFENEKND